MTDIKAALKKAWSGIAWDSLIIACVGVVLAFAIRYTLRGFLSRDYEAVLKDWYLTFLKVGPAVLRDGVTNYPPLYEYILLLSSLLFRHFSPSTAIKIPFAACDFLCAWYIYRIVRIKYTSGPIAIYAALAVLFAPTVVLNSSTWGQVDILYTTGLVACLYYVLKKKDFMTCLAYGVAISSKPQALFLAPFLVLLFLKRKIAFKYMLVIPAVFLVTLIPAWIAGRPPLSMLTIYTSQVDLFKRLQVNAPNMYTWFPESAYDQFYRASLIFGVSIVLLYIAMAYQSKVSFTAPVLVYLAQVSVLLVPYFMPKMHERYFFASDVISIIFAFYYPKKAYLSVILNVLSFFSYQYFLFGEPTFSNSTLAIFIIVVIIVLVWQLVLLLYQQPNHEPEIIPTPAPKQPSR